MKNVILILVTLFVSHVDTVISENQKTYKIDTLEIEERIIESEGCVSGKIYKYTLKGAISPDSTFAMNRLLKRADKCAPHEGESLDPITLILQSNGGLLEDGYKLGEILRKNNATAMIINKTMCASSCAVAFLGASKRMIDTEGSILFHAPYTRVDQKARCDASQQQLNVLKNYYIKMTDKEVGEMLMDRTMWYCSVENGWVLTGGNAAELYGIATELEIPAVRVGRNSIWNQRIRHCEYPSSKSPLVLHAKRNSLSESEFNAYKDICEDDPCWYNCEIFKYY